MPATAVRVLCFGPIRDAAGQREFAFELNSATVGAAWNALVDVAPGVASRRATLRVAINRVYTDWTAPLAAGDEVAFIPPVAGG